jgi:hypothetical protein
VCPANPADVSLSCKLLDLKNDKETPLTSGKTYELARDGAYDILCDMIGAEFVKFLYDGTKEHDAWNPPHVFSGIPEDEPRCVDENGNPNEMFKYISGTCGPSACSCTKTVTARAQQNTPENKDICKEATFHFKCAATPPSPPAPTPTPPTPTPPSTCDLKNLTGLKTCSTKSWWSYCFGSTTYQVFEVKYGKCYSVCLDKYKLRYYAYKYPGKYLCSCPSK